MRRLLSAIGRFLTELRRRKVYQVALAYLAAGFVVVELADIAAGTFDLPGWFGPLVWVVVGLGFPIALVLAWALEVTPEGVRVDTGEESSEEAVRAPATPGLWVGASVLALLLLGAWWLFGGLGPAEQASDASAEIQDRSIAVLPFEVSGAGAEEWRDGMVTMLSMNLDGAAGFRAISDRAVFAAWKKRGNVEEGLSPDSALAVARTVGAKYAVVGSAVQLGEELRLGAEIRRVGSGETLGTVEVKGAPGSVTTLTDRLTREVLGVLLDRSEEALPSVDLASITTSSLEALKSFLEGERRFRTGDYAGAVEDFKEATRDDSTFALAYARLAQAHWAAAGPKTKVAKNWHRARMRSGRLPSRDRRWVRAVDFWMNEGNGVAAADSLRQLAQSYPEDPTIRYSLGEVILHSSIPGGFPEADRAFKRGVDLDPGHLPYYHHFVQMAFMYHRDRALAAQRIAATPESRGKVLNQLAHGLVFGDSARRRGAFARLDTMALRVEDVPFVAVVGATLHPSDGQLQERVLRTIIGRDDTENTPYPPLLVGNSLEGGQVAQAAADLPTLSDSTVATCLLARASSLGAPVPDSAARVYLDATGVTEDAPAGRLACAGVYLADQRRSAALDQLLGRLRARAQRAEGRRGENAASLRAMIEELESYRAWKNGTLDSEASLPARSIFTNPVGWWPISWGGIWRGDLYRARGQLQKAEGWYLGTWWHPVAHERLGQLYETMDRPADAAAAYERFVAAWEQADPELQDRVEAAQQRLDALRAEVASE